jgi:ABC-type nitrate/sulfonate/bicarbonate transport system ATPase subunit
MGQTGSMRPGEGASTITRSAQAGSRHRLSGCSLFPRLTVLVIWCFCEPEILLLDEPFGALDPGVSSDMHELILKTLACET